MIILEHVAMYVHDLERTKNFFMKYLQARANELYHNPKTGFSSYFLSFDSGARLEIMTKEILSEMDKPLNRTGLSHLAISVGSTENVDALTQRLKEDGYVVVSGPRTTGDGYYESLFLDFENNQIEITA